MRPEDFVHLHVHSHYSLLDGSVKIDGLVEKAVSCGMKALALTDHGALFGAIEFYKKAKAAGIKPIIGMEAYMAEGALTEKRLHGRPSRNYHLTLLARNEAGYKNLIRLSSLAYIKGFYRRPRVDVEHLASHSDGLIALSGCLSGRIPCAFRFDQPDKARETAITLKEIFGPENFYIEIMKNGLEEQEKVNPLLIDLARELDLPLVATNDIHYLERKDALVQEVLICIQRNQLLKDENRQRMDSDEFFFKDGEEMIRLFADVPDALENTSRIADRCDLELEFGRYHIPEFKPDKGLSPERMLRDLCVEGVINRYGDIRPEVEERLDYELGVINKMGFVSYFLIVWDFIRFAKENNIPVGPGRGSAAGSVVAYALGITELDPLKYDLLFERFLNSSRISMPDIDIDFCVKGREKVVNYVREKYGAENVCQIVTFGTLAARGALRDAGRVLDIDLALVDRIAKKIPAMKPQGEKRSLLELTLTGDSDVKELVENDSRIRELFEISRKIEGINRDLSTHAAGVVITEEPLSELAPLCRVNDEVNTQYQMTVLEDIGLLKMDFLGLKNLTTIDKAVKLIEENQGTRIDLDNLPLDNEKTYMLLQNGWTQGIFQLESQGMVDLLLRLQPDNFDDIIAVLALYRPGPLDSGMTDQYVERKHERQEIDTLHPILAEVLEDTYGVIVYQEQVMRIANVMAGFSLNDADALRKAMGKKKMEQMVAFQKAFIDGAEEKGVERSVADEIFGKIMKFARYGFNKSHSAAYSVITYRTAYLKANYPLEFMAALLSCDAGNSEKIAKYIEECHRMDIEVLGPDYAKSVPDFGIEGDRIRFGLNAIKGLGEKAAESIVLAREESAGFGSVSRMLETIDLKAVGKIALETLIKAGAFDTTGVNRASYFESVDRLLKSAATVQNDRKIGQSSLFGGDNGESDEIAVTDCDDWDEETTYIYEKEALGFVLSINPLLRYERLLKALSTASVEGLKSLEEGIQVIVGGMLVTPRVMLARKGRYAGKKIALFKVQTTGGTVSAVLFSEEFEKYGHLVQDDKLYFFAGTVDRKREDPGLIVAEILTIDEAIKEYGSAFLIRFDGSEDEANNDLLARIRETCSSLPGEFDILLHFKGEGRNGHTVRAGSKFRVEPTLQTFVELEKTAGTHRLEVH